jgi:hypothetical protein
VPRKEQKKQKKAMSFPLLQVIGDVLGKDETKTTFEKLRFWTVCLWGFFGSLRIGELLSSHKNSFDPHSYLLWKDAKSLGNDDILVVVKSPKTRNPGGE